MVRKLAVFAHCMTNHSTIVAGSEAEVLTLRSGRSTFSGQNSSPSRPSGRGSVMMVLPAGATSAS